MNKDVNKSSSDETIIDDDSHLPSGLNRAGMDVELDDSFSDDAGDVEEFGDEQPEGLQTAGSKHRSRKRLGLHCFNCNRHEGHYSCNVDRWYYSFLTGLSFGLIRFVGPFQCQCCGNRRLMMADILNIRYLMRNKGAKSKTSSSRRSRS